MGQLGCQNRIKCRPFLVWVHLLYLHYFQKIRTVELDGKTIKLQIVSTFSLDWSPLDLFFSAFSSGTLPARRGSGPSHPAITEGQTESSLFMMSQTRYVYVCVCLIQHVSHTTCVSYNMCLIQHLSHTYGIIPISLIRRIIFPFCNVHLTTYVQIWPPRFLGVVYQCENMASRN